MGNDQEKAPSESGHSTRTQIKKYENVHKVKRTQNSTPKHKTTEVSPLNDK